MLVLNLELYAGGKKNKNKICKSLLEEGFDFNRYKALMKNRLVFSKMYKGCKRDSDVQLNIRIIDRPKDKKLTSLFLRNSMLLYYGNCSFQIDIPRKGKNKFGETLDFIVSNAGSLNLNRDQQNLVNNNKYISFDNHIISGINKSPPWSIIKSDFEGFDAIVPPPNYYFISSLISDMEEDKSIAGKKSILELLEKYFFNGNTDKFKDFNDFYSNLFGSFGSKSENAPDGMRAAEDLGLEKLLYSGRFWDVTHSKVELKSFIKDLKDNFKEKLDAVVLFGSLARGNYIRNLENYEKLMGSVENKDDNLKFWTYSFLGDMLNYPYGSDVDLCFIIEDEEKDIEKVKNEIKEILLKYADKYYFEHFSIIKKSDFYKILDNFHKYIEGKGAIDGESADDLQIEIYTGILTDEDYKKAEKKKAKADAKKKSVVDIWNEKKEDLKKRLEAIKNSNDLDGTQKLMIEYSLDRLKQENRAETNFEFSAEDVFKAMGGAYAILFNPTFKPLINNINIMFNINDELQRKFWDSAFERALNDIKDNDVLNKWHFLKWYRHWYLHRLEKIIKSSLLI